MFDDLSNVACSYLNLIMYIMWEIIKVKNHQMMKN
jgi:hypothetical protein